MGLGALVLALVCILLIWRFSLEDGARSGKRSGQAMLLLGRLFSAITPDSAELLLRKAAHFSEYALLGSILAFALVCFDKPLTRHFPHVLLPCLLGAVLDEAIQLYVPGRGSSTVDVLIDFAGAVTGLLIVGLLTALLRRRKSHKGAHRL